MHWHIISIGDEAYLYKIFQFLSMLNSPGTSLYGTLGMLGALIGLMLLLFQAVSSSGRNFSFGSLMIGIVMFSVLFGSSTTVELEDFHTGRTDIVNGVPLGTAIMGTLVSEGGAAVINLFQQGTAVPGQEVMPSDYALRALSATYSLSAMTGCVGNTALCPLKNTLRSYWSNCVYPQYLGQGTGTPGWTNGDPTKSPDALKAIQSVNHFTITSDYLHGTTGTPTLQTCADTYTDIERFFSSTPGSDSFACQYLAAAGQSLPGGAPSGTCTSQAQTLLQNSFNGLKGGADTSGGQSEGKLGSMIQEAQGSNLLALRNLVIASAAHDAQAFGGQGTSSDIANAAMVESAAQQRDIKYAAEESMFGRTLNATIAFFEGVIYGLAPFMAFLVPLGAIGVKYLLRYFQLLVWLFLWLPLLSFVNLYEIMAVMRQMNALQPTLNGAPLYSMVGIMQVQNAAADWIALGGWFTTSIIGLSGMIVFGSVAAFQSIAQAAHGPDAVDASTVAPELASSAPTIQSGSVYSSSGGEGLHLTGGPTMQFSASTALQKNRQIAAQNIVGSLQKLGIKDIDQHSLSEQALHAQLLKQFGGRVHDSSISGSDGFDRSAAVTAGHDSTTASKTDANVGGSVKVEAKGGFTILGTGATVKGEIHAAGQHDWQWSEGSKDGQTEQVGGGTAVRSSRSDGVRGGVEAADSSGETKTYVDGKSTAWNSQLDQTISALHSYTDTASETSQIGASSTVNASQVASQFSMPEHAADLASAKATVNDLGEATRGYYQQTFEQLHEIYPNASQADAVATMATLQWAANNGSGASQIIATESLLKGLNAVNPMMSSTTMRDTTGFLEKSQELQSILSKTDGMSSEVGSAISDHGWRTSDPGDGGLRAGARNAAQVVSSQVPDMATGVTQDKEARDANAFVDHQRDAAELKAMHANQAAAIRAREHNAEASQKSKENANVVDGL